MTGLIILNKEKIEAWLKCREWNQKQLAESLNYDESILSKIINGEMEPSKQLMRKIMLLTGLDLAVFTFDRNRESQDREV